MNSSFFPIFLCIGFILTGCSPLTTPKNTPGLTGLDCNLSRDENILLCNGTPQWEVIFLRRPQKESFHIQPGSEKWAEPIMGSFVGIVIVDIQIGHEKWIYPSGGWELEGAGIKLANQNPTRIKDIKRNWDGTILGSKVDALTICSNVHFTTDNSALSFSTIGLLQTNPVWEYSFKSGKVRKIGHVRKK